MAASMDKGTRAVLANAQAAVDQKAEEMVGTMKLEEMVGSGAPMGVWDPLGFCTNVDDKTLLYYREAELKHGRLGMLASLGIFIGEQYHPLYGGNIDDPAVMLGADAFKVIIPGLQARQGQPPDHPELQGFWLGVTIACALIDLSGPFFRQTPWEPFSGWRVKEGWTKGSDDSPGNYGFDPFGYKPKNQAKWVEMQNKEINNGRLAMLAAAGMIAQEMVTGKAIFPLGS
jgi:hypothetical protein